MNEIPKELLKFFKDNELFVLCAHEAPDADAIGAEYALAHLLLGLGKKYLIFNSDPPPPKYAFIDLAGILPKDGKTQAALPPEARFIILDTNDLFNLGSSGEFVRVHPESTLIIDHHEFKKEKNCLCWNDPACSSTCEMVFRLFGHYGLRIEKHVAEALFTGIVFDTGSFIYSKTEASTFEAARILVEAGARPYEIHGKMYESSTIGALKLETMVLSSLTLEEGERVAFLRMDQETIRRAGAGYDDAENFINFPLQGRTVEVSVFLKEKPDGSYRCSLRSKGKVNVARIAQGFGGGGHRTAAGFKCAQGPAETRTKVLDMIARELP